MFGRHGRSGLKAAGWGAVLYLAAIPYFAAATLGYRLILHVCRYEVEPQGIVTVFFAPEYPLWLRLYLLVVGVLIAPVAEEILFRGIILPMALRRNGVVYAVAISALLFACIHMHVPALVPLFVMAAAFALGYLYTGSILTPIVMHVLFNAVNLTALYLLQRTDLVGL
jgi:membrane protease YdiL (CAAX protease family)